MEPVLEEKKTKGKICGKKGFRPKPAVKE